MTFEHGVISPESDNFDDVDFQFNPTEYADEKTNQIAETAIPGLKAPVLQFVHGQSRTLSMDLFFDTWEEQSDVSDKTDDVYALLEIDPDTHVPPICNVTWGSFSFRGVLEKVSGKFNLFFSDGRPARATLSVSFKEFNDVTVMIRERPTQSANHTKTRVVQAGDRISAIAFDEYGDAGNWRPIAQANHIENPHDLEPGRVLVIPPIQ